MITDNLLVEDVYPHDSLKVTIICLVKKRESRKGLQCHATLNLRYNTIIHIFGPGVTYGQQHMRTYPPTRTRTARRSKPNSISQVASKQMDKETVFVHGEEKVAR